MSDEIKVQSKNTKSKLIIAIAAVVIAVLTIVAIVLVSSGGATAKKVKEQLSLGNKYLSELNYEQAIAAYELAIVIDPKSADAYLGLAEVYEEMGEFDKAIAILEEVKTVVGEEELKHVEAKIKDVEKKQEATKTVETAMPVPTATPEPTPTLAPTPTPTATPFKEIEQSDGRFRYAVKKDGTIKILGLVDMSVSTVEIPEEIEGRVVSEIGAMAFSNCVNLKSIDISNTVVRIGHHAFMGCYNLETINLSERIEDNVDEKNEKFVSIDGVLFSKDRTELIRMPPGRRGENYEIPDGVIKIGENAFEGCGFQSILLAESVKEIGRTAFLDCHNLEEISIPGSVEKIGAAPFSACYSLQIINVDESNQYYCVIDGGLYDKERTILIQMPYVQGEKEWSIYDGAIEIGEMACANAQYSKIYIPESVTVIGASAFLAANELRSVVVPEGVIKIELHAFGMCSKLTDIIIPRSVVCIEEIAFANCSNLTITTYKGSCADQYANENEIPVRYQ